MDKSMNKLSEQEFTIKNRMGLQQEEFNSLLDVVHDALIEAHPEDKPPEPSIKAVFSAISILPKDIILDIHKLGAGDTVIRESIVGFLIGLRDAG